MSTVYPVAILAVEKLENLEEKACITVRNRDEEDKEKRILHS